MKISTKDLEIAEFKVFTDGGCAEYFETEDLAAAIQYYTAAIVRGETVSLEVIHTVASFAPKEEDA